MIGERAFHEGRMFRFFAYQRAVDVMAELMAERRRDRARMMCSVDEDHELAVLAELGTAIESPQRQPRAGAVRLGPQFEFARTEQVAEMTEQLPAAELRQTPVSRRRALPGVIVDYLLQFPQQRLGWKRGHVLLDVILDDLFQFPEQRLGWKRGHIHVVGGENFLQVSQLIQDSAAERAERNLDLAKQLGNEMVNFTSYQRVRLSRSGSLGRGWRWSQGCAHKTITQANRHTSWHVRRFTTSDSRCISRPTTSGKSSKPYATLPIAGAIESHTNYSSAESPVRRFCICRVRF